MSEGCQTKNDPKKPFVTMASNDNISETYVTGAHTLMCSHNLRLQMREIFKFREPVIIIRTE